MSKDNTQRKTYLLLSGDNINQSTKLNDNTSLELIDIDNFKIKEIPINDIEPGQWFIFADVTECSGTPCVSVTNGKFAYLCVKNNKNGSVDVRTTSFDFKKNIEIIGKINNMIKEQTNESTIN